MYCSGVIQVSILSIICQTVNSRVIRLRFFTNPCRISLRKPSQPPTTPQVLGVYLVFLSCYVPRAARSIYKHAPPFLCIYPKFRTLQQQFPPRSDLMIYESSFVAAAATDHVLPDCVCIKRLERPYGDPPKAVVAASAQMKRFNKAMILR